MRPIASALVFALAISAPAAFAQTTKPDVSAAPSAPNSGAGLVGEIIPRSAAIVGYEVTADFPAIGRRTMLVSARRLVHPDNNSTSILFVFEDVTDRRVGDAQKDVLLAETRHRMKNLLAIVRSLASQTDVEGRSAKDYRDAFLGRFQAVAEAESLALAGGAPADLRALVEQALRPAADRCRIAPGAVVTLSPRQIVPMSLILHELMTNVWKYGAYSRSGGLVHVSWNLAGQEDKTVLHLDWHEENGPPVTPPTRTGFGSRLIDISAVQGLRGTLELKYEPTGLRVHLTAPMES
ncbi:sensor histidine kinase [Bradyrhizobium sp. B117]|uniref:sensor histidine kinase n=1 Tax=Bradyrhizobium sp. B117 TaxID=3140246 RepID=UPI003182C221